MTQKDLSWKAWALILRYRKDLSKEVTISRVPETQLVSVSGHQLKGRWGVKIGPTLVSESESHSVVSDSLQPQGLYSPWNPPGQNTGVGNLSLLQGIFPTQGSNPGLPHCRQILYQLSHQGNPELYMLRLCNMNRFDTWYALRTFTSVKAMSIPVTFRDLISPAPPSTDYWYIVGCILILTIR